MNHLPLVRANSLLPLLKFLRENGISQEEFIRYSKLPENIFYHGENFVSLHQALKTVNIFAYREGEELGILASQKLEIDDLGVLGKVINNCLTVYDLLQTFVTLLKKTYSSGVKLWLTEDCDRIWFYHQFVNMNYEKNDPSIYYAFLLHLKVITSMIDGNLSSTEIHFRGQAVKKLLTMDLFSQCRVYFNQPYNSIAIPKNLLYLPLKQAYQYDINEEQDLYEQLNLSPPATDFVNALKQLIRSQLLGGNIKIETIADSIGMSTRSLQRCLGDRGLSYSRLLDQVRLQLAVECMKDPNISIGEIAFELQYSEMNSFSRSFKRWTGVTPSEYRNRLYRGE